jgi:transposase-like protein
MPDVSEANKIVARRVAKAFGRRPKITTMWDADNRSSVCKRIGISDQTFYRWRLKYGALKEVLRGRQWPAASRTMKLQAPASV